MALNRSFSLLAVDLNVIYSLHVRDRRRRNSDLSEGERTVAKPFRAVNGDEDCLRSA
jgi:hypothetical protein